MMRFGFTPFIAVFKNELRLNSKRIAPYILVALFIVHATIWWGWGPAVELGWATNSDFYIVRNLMGFSFLLGLPVFNAVIMGDSVIRDFRLGIDPLLFSKPISRVEYLLGKFLGNFFVLVCCQSAFVVTLLLLQGFRTANMVVQPVRVIPYFKHFFFFVVISHLFLAALYFTVGTFTRNAKIVYVLAVCFYPIYISYQVFLLKSLSPRTRVLLDPMGLSSGLGGGGFYHSADYLNSLVITYSTDMIINRTIIVFLAGLFLSILILRFRVAEKPVDADPFTTLNLISLSEPDFVSVQSDPALVPAWETSTTRRATKHPTVAALNGGVLDSLNKLVAAVQLELRLLRIERSLVVLIPLTVFISTMEVAFYNVIPDISYSAAYATNTSQSLLLLLLGMIVFYTGEAMHRDREMRIEPIIWATPTTNNSILLSRFFATLTLMFSIVALVGLTAIGIQYLRGNTPVEVTPFLITYVVILVPSIIFLTAITVAINVLLRSKHVAYVTAVGTSAALFYLYSLGYNHPLVNPFLYRRWNYSDLAAGGVKSTTLLHHRIYFIALASACLAIAHIIFERKSTMESTVRSRLIRNRWPVVILLCSLAIAIATGLSVYSRG